MGEKTIVEGTVVALHASIHEEGHDLKIMVKLPNRKSFVRVTIPKTSSIDIGSKVELMETKMLFFNVSRYRFYKYVG